MITSSYDNVPIFSPGFYGPDNFLGTATIIVSDNKEATIVINANQDFVKTLDLRELKGLYLSAVVVVNLDEENKE